MGILLVINFRPLHYALRLLRAALDLMTISECITNYVLMAKGTGRGGGGGLGFRV